MGASVMRSNAVLIINLAIGFLLLCIGAASAQCMIPNQLTNGQTADATQVMGDLNQLVNCLNSGELVVPPVATLVITSPSGGTATLQNPSATANYNFNLPAGAGTIGQLLTSAGGGANPQTWTSTGTSGHVLPFLDGSNNWTGTQSFGPVVGSVSTQGGTTYTLAATDCGTTILFTSASPITLTTLNTLPVGCSIAIEQGGSGQVTIVAGSGATQNSAHGFTKTYSQYSILGLFVDTNAGGSAADIIITGDGA